MDSRDRRTKRQKLEAMANQAASPNEAQIAKDKLAQLSDEELDAAPTGKFHVTINGIDIEFSGDIEVSFNHDPDSWLDGVWVLEGDEFKHYK